MLFERIGIWVGLLTTNDREVRMHKCKHAKDSKHAIELTQDSFNYALKVFDKIYERLA